MRLFYGLAAVFVLLLPLRGEARTGGDKKRSPELLNAELFLAITDHSPARVKVLLDAGADPNGRNWLGVTPLHWAAQQGQSEAVTMLLRHGAQINVSSIYGSPLTFSALGRQGPLGAALLDRGADPNPKRVDGTTPLMIAASNGNLDLIRKLLARRADPSRRDQDGAMALTYAARRGQADAARILIGAGAPVDVADSHGWTPLMYAAANGFPNVVELLVSRRANVRAVNRNGATPLLLAARYSGDPTVVRILLRAGAAPEAADATGKTAYALASARGFREAANLLPAGNTARAVSEVSGDGTAARQSVQRALQVVQSGMKTFADRSQCVSCHHQGLGLMTLGQARRHGMEVNPALVESYIRRIAAEGESGGPAVHSALSNPEAGKQIPAVDIGDFCFGAAYFFSALHANGVPANPGLGEMARFIASMQKPDGAWRFAMNRGTMQNSNVATTALVLQVMDAYWPGEAAAEKARRLQQARTWLLGLQPRTAEEMAARIIGLKTTGADEADMRQAVQLLTAAQMPDGGWGTGRAPRSDAYATGISLYALRTAGGLPATEGAVRRAVDFLTRTQDEDGSWYVNKITPAYNNHFDGGFPHGYSQYASFAGTCWATLGLLETLEPPAPRSADTRN